MTTSFRMLGLVAAAIMAKILAEIIMDQVHENDLQMIVRVAVVTGISDGFSFRTML